MALGAGASSVHTCRDDRYAVRMTHSLERDPPFMSYRTATIERNTRETRIAATVALDGSGAARLETGIPFFEHMLEQVARHGVIDIDLRADGDVAVDDHHTVEDTGIVLGQANRRSARRQARNLSIRTRLRPARRGALEGRHRLLRAARAVLPGELPPRADRGVRRGPDPRVLPGIRERGGGNLAHRLAAPASTPITSRRRCSRRSAARCEWRWPPTSGWGATVPSTKGVL